MPRTVKAAVMVKPGVLETQEFPYPSIGREAMLLRVEKCGICGTDKHTFRGETTQYGGTKAETVTPFPIIPGHELVGVIAEAGKDANETMNTGGETLKVGDRVVICPDLFCGKCYYCRNYAGFIWCDNMRSYGNSLSSKEPPHLFGGWAEYVYLVPGTYVSRVPDNMKPDVAVLAELMAVTYNLDKAKEFYSMSGDGFKSGDTIVVQGSGPVGLCHIIKSRMLGAGDIIAIDKSDLRLAKARSFGADFSINLKTTTSQQRIQQVLELTEGRGADLVIECAGAAQAVPEGIDMLRKGGMYIETGIFADVGPVSINPHRHLCAKNIRLIGQTNHPPTAYRPSLKLMEKYKSFFPPFEQLVTHQYKVEEAEQALEKSMHEEESLKVVISP